MAIESKAALRFARISPRKARVIVNLVRGKKVSQALDELAFTPKSGAPIVKGVSHIALWLTDAAPAPTGRQKFAAERQAARAATKAAKGSSPKAEEAKSE